MKGVLHLLKKLLALIIIIVIVDQLFGLCFTPIFFKQVRGKFFTTSYALKTTKDDILVIGASHAAQHFDAKLMESKMGVSVFNLGNQKQSMLYYYPLIKSILLRHKPKVIILTLEPDELQYSTSDYDVLSIFLPYCGSNSYIDSAITLSDKTAKFKCLSNLYRYNSTLGYVFLYLIDKSYNKSIYSLGFDPQYGNNCKRSNASNFTQAHAAKSKPGGVEAIHFKTSVDANKKIVSHFDSLKIKYLVNIISELKQKNIKLLVVTTPLYEIHNSIYADSLSRLLTSKKVAFINRTNDKTYSQNCDLFYDANHLNIKGADMFTNMIVDSLKSKTFIK